MFGIILAEEKPGDTPLSQEIRQVVIKGGLADLNVALRQLPHVLPEMSAVQIAFIKIALSEAVNALYHCEQHLAAVKRVTDARVAAGVA